MALNKIRLLNGDQLLQSLKENGYIEIEDILDGRGINGQMLLELSELQTRFWNLSQSQKTTLFSFIKDVTKNPSLIIKPESVTKVYNTTKDQNEFKQLLALTIANNSPFKKRVSSPSPPVPVKPPTPENPPIHHNPSPRPSPTEPLSEYDHPRHLNIFKPIPMQDYDSNMPDMEYDHPRQLIPKPEIIRHYPIPMKSTDKAASRHIKPPLPPQKPENKRSNQLPPLTGSSEATRLRHPKSKPNIEALPEYDNPRNQKVSIQQTRLDPLPSSLPEPMPENSQNVSIIPKRPPLHLPPALLSPEYINLQELNLTDNSNNSSYVQMGTSNNLSRNKFKANLTPEAVILPLKYPTNRLSSELLENESQKISIRQKRLDPLPLSLPEPMPENSRNVSIIPKRPPTHLPPALLPPEYVNLQELHLTDKSDNSFYVQMGISNNLSRNKLTPEPVITPLKYPTDRLSSELLENESQMETQYGMEDSEEIYMNLPPVPPTLNEEYINLQESLLRGRENDSYSRQTGTNLNRNKSKTNLPELITTPSPPAPDDQYMNLQECNSTNRANNSSKQTENNLNQNNSKTNLLREIESKFRARPQILKKEIETMNIYSEEQSEGYLTPAEMDSKYINGLIARMHAQNKGMSSSLKNLLKEQFYDETDDSFEQTYENLNKRKDIMDDEEEKIENTPPLIERPPIPLPGNNRPKSLEVGGQKDREIRDRSNSSAEQNGKINTSKSDIRSPEVNTTNLQQSTTKSTSNISPTPQHKWKSNDYLMGNAANDQLRPNFFGSLNRIFTKKQATKNAIFSQYENYVPNKEDESRPQIKEKISFRDRPLPPIPPSISPNRNISPTPKNERNPGDLLITPNAGNISATSKKEWNNVDLRITSNTEKKEWNSKDLRIRKPRNFEEMTLPIQKNRQSAEMIQQEILADENVGNKENMSHDPIIQETKVKLEKPFNPNLTNDLAMELSRALKSRAVTINASRDDDDDDDHTECEFDSGEIYTHLTSEDDEANLLFDVSNEKFFRNTDRTGAKELLQNLPNGAFLFRPSQNHFLVLTLKYKGQCYNLGIERTPKNWMRISADTASVSPEFKTLRGFVDYFTREAVTFRDNDDSIVEIFLNPILSNNLL